MPRKAPDGQGVIEHRITFGNYERERLNELQNSISFAQYMSPLKSPVVAVGLAGGLGYLGLAYVMEWWPFDSPETRYGFGFMDRVMHENFSNILANADADLQLKLAELDEKHAQRTAWVAANPDPDSFFKRMQLRQYNFLIAQYPLMRQNIIDDHERIVAWAEEQIAKAEEESDYV